MNKSPTVPAMAALAMSLLFVAQPASAAYSSITSYCSDHLYTNTQLQTPPNAALYCQMQAFGGSWYGYTGRVTGVMNVNSWKAMQTYLKRRWKYEGVINGIPGPLTYKAMQRAGNASGWYYPEKIPLDGAMSTRDWRAWAYHVKSTFFGV